MFGIVELDIIVFIHKLVDTGFTTWQQILFN